MLFLVTGHFPSSQEQFDADEALLEFNKNGSQETNSPSFRALARIHLQQSGKVVAIVEASNIETLDRQFLPLRKKFGMTFLYEPGLSTGDLINYIKGE